MAHIYIIGFFVDSIYF